ncbi:hypothetical protein [Leptospira weilii]|uniref:hypothetical protein n=1 Tax=Leptospira weilii TaxID=28184 RepID=UPI0018DED7DB|nr:hypothetical protein [Leptospira weilii]
MENKDKQIYVLGEAVRDKRTGLSLAKTKMTVSLAKTKMTEVESKIADACDKM